MKASSFPIYPCCLATAGPSFVKSAVADGKVGGRKWTYRMSTGRLAFPYRENRDQEVNICDSMMQKEMNRAVGGCVMVPEHLSLKWDSLVFCFSFHFLV